MPSSPSKNPTALSDAGLIERLGASKSSESEEEKANRKLAEQDLAAIFDLRDNASFQWFRKECLEKRYESVRDIFHAADTPKELLPEARAAYHSVREIYVWIIEREIEMRRVVNPADAEIANLRQKLRLL